MTDKILEGHKASQLLSNPTYQQAVSSLRDKYYRRIETSAGSAREEREEAYYLLKTLRLLEQEIKSVVDAGKVAEHEQKNLKALEKLNKLKQ